MFKEIRRKDRQITREEAEKILKNGEYGIFSTCDGKFPYGVPVNYVYFNDCIYFHCAKEGHKLSNIELNPNVSFCVVGRTQLLPDKFSTIYESAILFGTAILVEGDEKRTALLELIKKYSPDFLEPGIEYINRASENTYVVKIEILNLTGKARKA
ncbi:Pyridoxamine 5'-phosphate oxidase [Caloramator mitchellensis]|uniref:Pyridoxamine 5'-phosphate oxidase n=1 Tax=Caloramator mitchellensis TaxID=908809 RepID=A0A0R3K0L3_CALMK|nr:pyridoxamine 5'-phosphate oxidase family protein [Caloramator mitchellensis]KRQ86780.1 Pyridoxamine 5'-phosphate oxidase [Caloramator mitchellensis]